MIENNSTRSAINGGRYPNHYSDEHDTSAMTHPLRGQQTRQQLQTAPRITTKIVVTHTQPKQTTHNSSSQQLHMLGCNENLVVLDISMPSNHVDSGPRIPTWLAVPNHVRLSMRRLLAVKKRRNHWVPDDVEPGVATSTLNEVVVGHLRQLLKVVEASLSRLLYRKDRSTDSELHPKKCAIIKKPIT